MISKENFCAIIRKIQKYEDFIGKIDDWIQLEKFDELFIPSEINDIFWKSMFTIPQVDIINVYLYEPECLEEDIDSPEELYDYLIQAS